MGLFDKGTIKVSSRGGKPVDQTVNLDKGDKEENSNPEETKEPDNQTDVATNEETPADESGTEVPQTDQPESSATAETSPPPTEAPKFNIGDFEDPDKLYEAYQELVNKPEPQPVDPLGDDFIKGVVDYYNKTGDLTPYLEAKSVDFDQLSDLAILKREMRKGYPENLSEDVFEKVFRRKVEEEYKLDPDSNSEEDVELGKALLAARAAKLRQEFKEAQAQFKTPEPQGPSEKEIAEFVKQINEAPATVRLGKEKAVKFGDFSYGVNPQEIVELVMDESKFWNLMKDSQGKLDLDKLYRVFSVALYDDKVIKGLMDHGKNAGADEVLITAQNPPSPEGKSDDNPVDEREAMLKAAIAAKATQAQRRR